MADIKSGVKKGIAPIVVFLAILIIAGMTAAASISVALKTGVVGAAGFIELYLLMFILDAV